MTQITIDNRPRLQKLQNMLKMKVIMKTANEAMEEILHEKDLNITALNHLSMQQQRLLQKKSMELESTNYKHRGQRHRRGLDAYRGA